MGSVGHILHSYVSGMRKVEALISMLGLEGYRFYKKRDGTCSAKLVFFHPVGSAGQVVDSSASGD
jgi:hypothetical protein